MTPKEFYQAAYKEVRNIEEGRASVELVAGDVLLGHVEYVTSNGWRLKIFSDGDDWDYIESVIPPTGEQFSLWPGHETEDCDEMRRLRSYRPPEDQLGRLWGFLT